MAISRERMVVEIRDWCQNVGEYNTYNFCIWHFGLCVIVSKIERCRSSDPPYEIAINPWWRGGRGLPSLIALLAAYYRSILMCSILCQFFLRECTRHVANKSLCHKGPATWYIIPNGIKTENTMSSFLKRVLRWTQ